MSGGFSDPAYTQARRIRELENRVAALEAKAALSAHPQAKPIGREELARMIDHEGCWERLDNLNAAIRFGIASDEQHMELCHVRDQEIEGTRDSLAIADAILSRIAGERGAGEWRTMDSAPRDGTVVDACARFKDATSGAPKYVHFLSGEWRAVGRDMGEPLICWMWRPRTDWPHEPAATAPPDRPD